MPLETPRTYVNMVFEPEEAPRRRRFQHKRVVGGIAAIAALAVAGGFLLPMIGHEPASQPAKAPAARVAPPAAAPTATTDGLNIIVDHTPPPPAPLPAGVTALPASPPPSVAPQPVQRAAPTPVVEAPRPKMAEAVAPPPPVTRPVQRAAPPPAAAPVRPAPAPRVAVAPEVRPYTRTLPPTMRSARTTRPSFNCRYARTVSEQMVCTDPNLAAADRRMASAYEQAIRRGVPERELRRQQDIWLGIRETAARSGPEGVWDAYAQRTAELQGMAR